MMKGLITAEARTLIDICKYLEINKWLDIVDMLEANGGETENFSYNDWFVLWLVQQNDTLYQTSGEYFTLQGFFDLSQVIPDGPIFKDKQEIGDIIKSLIDKGLVTMKGY